MLDGRYDYKRIIFLAIGIAQLFWISKVSDLPISVGNWFPKAEEISSFHIPESNFYPAGSALLLVPFLMLKSNPLIILMAYFSLGNVFFYEIVKLIKDKKYQTLALGSIILNPYLLWLIYTSQDTVFEYFLLMLCIFLLLNKKFLYFLFFGLILNLCRPAYWVYYLLIGIFLFIYNYISTKKYNWKYLLPFIFLLLNLTYNYYAYNNVRLADESGITAYFSYNKDLYLSLPLFDMDVFLSKGGHMSNPYNFGESPSAYSKAAIKSIKENPKEILLSTMQKIDSYVFVSQKVPKLPGEYYLSEDGKSIVIGQQRLTWMLVLGNLIYQIYRGTLFILFMLCIGILIGTYSKNRIRENQKNLFILVFPWISGLISCTIFYTETRFKIVSELLLVVFSLKILSEFRMFKKTELNMITKDQTERFPQI